MPLVVSDRSASGSVAFASLEAVVSDPVSCGFLRQFAAREHNAENLDFWVAIDRFHDSASSHSKEALRALADQIFTQFVDDAAENQVSLDATTLRHLEARLAATPGEAPPDVFDASQAKAMETLRRDMFPRFRGSAEMTMLLRRVHEHVPPHDFGVAPQPLPADSIPPAMGDMAELLTDAAYLRPLFQYLKKRYCLEHLMFSIECMLYMHRATVNPAGAADDAWRVYATYLRDENAAGYVQLSPPVLKQISLGVAAAEPTLFAEALAHSAFLLRQDVAQFFKTPEYAEAARAAEAAARPTGCFSFLRSRPAPQPTPAERYLERKKSEAGYCTPQALQSGGRHPRLSATAAGSPGTASRNSGGRSTGKSSTKVHVMAS